jgi:hypothetical protein
LELDLSPYKYQLQATKDSVSFSVTDCSQTTTKELGWALGDGRYGQTYVYRDHGKYYESQLSFYTILNGLDTTIGHMKPKDLETAAGGINSLSEIRQCFGCHFTAATVKGRFDPDGAVPGVSCEACHGPGLEHVIAQTMEASSAVSTDQRMMDISKLSPVDSVDFCGACHRTSADTVGTGMDRMGLANVRMQPYRLEKSKCWGVGDTRLTCVGCHDPHVQLVSDPGFYDAKCEQCHTIKAHAKTTAHRPPVCRVASKSCVTCHMPQVEVPGTHSTFTDHWIRIARRAESYPGRNLDSGSFGNWPVIASNLEIDPCQRYDSEGQGRVATI